MTKRFITDEELVVATTMVSEAMLRALPEPEDCIGQFTAQFEEKNREIEEDCGKKSKLEEICSKRRCCYIGNPDRLFYAMCI